MGKPWIESCSPRLKKADLYLDEDEQVRQSSEQGASFSCAARSVRPCFRNPSLGEKSTPSNLQRTKRNRVKAPILASGGDAENLRILEEHQSEKFLPTQRALVEAVEAAEGLHVIWMIPAPSRFKRLRPEALPVGVESWIGERD
jgi:hypothetical protein